MGAAVGNKEESRPETRLSHTPRGRASPVEPTVAYPDYLRLKQRLANLEDRLKIGKKDFPQPRPPLDSLEDTSLSPIKPLPKPYPEMTSDPRIIRHGASKPASCRTSPKPRIPKSRQLATSTSPKAQTNLQQASSHLFDFATRLMDEKERFLHHKKSEEMRLLKAKEDLIREQLNLSKGGKGAEISRPVTSLPVTPTHGRGKSAQEEVEELIVEAEQRVNLLNGDSGVSFLKMEYDVSKESNCFPNLSSIRHSPCKSGLKPSKKRTLSKPDIVHVDLSSASKLRSRREKPLHKRMPSSSPCKPPEVKDLLILLQESSIEDTPKPKR